jgi:hypothetical protein
VIDFMEVWKSNLKRERRYYSAKLRPSSTSRAAIGTPEASEMDQKTESSGPEHSIARLIRRSRTTKIPWIIEGLWQEGGIVIVHSLEETFKSVFCYQIAEAVAAGSTLLRSWTIPVADE